MPVGTRKEQEMAARRRKVASLYLRGVWQPEIAGMVGISQSTVSRDLAVVRKQWLKDAKADYDAKVAEQLAKIDAVELEAWTEWQKSKGRERTKRAVKKYGGKGGKMERTEETTTVETLLPEARYLEIVRTCIERRCKLLGLDAPERRDITTGGEQLGGGFTDSQRLALLAALAERAGGAAEGPDSGE